MIKINLLGDTLAQVPRKPEKAEAFQVYGEAEAEARPGFPIVGVLLAVLLPCLGGVYYMVLNGQVEQEARTQVELQAKKKELAKYIELEKTFRAQKEALEKKKAVMIGLKSLQHLPVHFLEELANCLPDDVWFKEINQKGMNISIKGESSSFEAINLFLNRLQAQTKWFQHVIYPGAVKNGRTVEFTISCDLKNAG